MKVSKKLFIMFVLFLTSFVLLACDKTTEATTAAPTTVAPTTVAPTTVAPTTVAPDLAAVITDLEEFYADTLGSETYLVSGNIALLSALGGVEIVWSSSDTTIVENDGSIHLPTFTAGNKTIILTATVANGDDSESTSFFVTVQAAAKTNQERADEVFLVVTAFPSKELWTAADNAELDFVVTGKDGDDVEYTIVWTSSHPEIIAITGTITQPEDADTDVTMTATVTIGSEDFTKEVVFSVAKMIEGTEVATIAAAIAAGEESYSKIMGVTVIAVTEMGDVYFTDGTDILYIYSASFDPIVGNVYDITGEMDYYYNSPQFKGSDVHPLKAEASTAAVTAAPVTTAAGITDIISGMTTPTPENLFAYEVYEVTAKVYYEEDWGNYSVFLVPTDYDYTAALASGATQPNGDSIMIYYKSNMEILAPLHDGNEITIQIITQGWRSDKMVWYANFFGDSSDIDITFANDAEAVATALAGVNLPAEIKDPMTLELPDELFGVTLTYSSDDELVINSTTGVVDLTGLVTRQLVTVTVTATLGTETNTKDIEIQVGELPLSTIAEAIVLGDGANVKIIGIITDTTDAAGYGAFWVQDATGALDLFNKSGVFTEDMIGKTYEFTGEFDVYNGLFELVVASVSDITELTGDDALTMPAAVDLSAMTLDDTTLLPYQGSLVDLTGFILAYDLSATYTSSFNMSMFNPTSGEQISVRIDKDVPGFADFVTLVGGTVAFTPVDFTNVIVGWYNGPQLLVPSNATITVGTTLTDAELLPFDLAELVAGAAEVEAVEYETLELPTMGSFGSTITWTLVSGTATLTVDELYLDFFGTEHDVVLEATLTLGTETPVVQQFTLTVAPIWTAYGMTAVATATEVTVTYADTPTNWWDNNLQGIVSEFDGTKEAIIFTFTGEVGQTYKFKIEGNGQAVESDHIVATGSSQEVEVDLSALTGAQRDGLNLIVVFPTTVAASGTLVVEGWDYVYPVLGTEMVETFTNLVIPEAYYGDGTFVGDNAITWTYTESGDHVALDGVAIMLDKNGDGASLSATIQGGIGTFSVDYFDAFGGAAEVELWINGVLIDTSVAVDYDLGDNTTVANFAVANINIAGEFAIEILSAGSQMVLDNLTWTAYPAS